MEHSASHGHDPFIDSYGRGAELYDFHPVNVDDPSAQWHVLVSIAWSYDMYQYDTVYQE